MSVFDGLFLSNCLKNTIPGHIFRNLIPTIRVKKTTPLSPKKIEEVALIAARKAAKILLHYHTKRDFKVSYKGDVNLVTDADFEAESAVIQTLLKNFPDHTIVSEENKQSHELSLEGPAWVIDPLDGTTNFSHGFPFFAVSIAYREKNKTQFGLIYQPVMKELFIAHRGKGSTLNRKKIKVSPTKDISKSLLATGFPYDRRESEQNNLKEFCELEMVSQCVRRPGAATLDLAYVACGRLDGYWEPKLSAWDVAAGSLLVEEAGGTVTTYNGDPLTDLWCREVVASNGKIHTKILDHLKK